MSRKETTENLSNLLEKRFGTDTRIYWAKEVTFDYSTDHAVRVDYMLFEPVNNTVGGIEQGIFSCYEIKSSVEDFNSGNGHNMLGDKNYYVMPKDVFEKTKHKIGWHVGVLCPEERFGKEQLVSVKNAHKVTRNRPASEMLLMMFRSANRENIKRIREKEDVG